MRSQRLFTHSVERRGVSQVSNGEEGLLVADESRKFKVVSQSDEQWQQYIAEKLNEMCKKCAAQRCRV